MLSDIRYTPGPFPRYYPPEPNIVYFNPSWLNTRPANQHISLNRHCQPITSPRRALQDQIYGDADRFIRNNLQREAQKAS